MITRELKLKLTKKQETQLNEWIPILTSIYNFGIRKIELNAKDKIYFSKFEFNNLLADHSKKLGVSSHTIQAVLKRSYQAWKGCFKKLSKKPKFKSVRNKLNSIPFPDPIPASRITNRTIQIPLLGKVRYHKQALPLGKVKQARIIKRASGWYLQLTIDAKHTFKVKDVNKQVGIDTGFKHLAILSDGTKFENERNFVKKQGRLAQAQRGKRKNLAARLQEHIKNKRKDYNHKVARRIVEDYSEIYITNDNLKGMSKVFGKSVSDAGIAQLRNFITYKGDNHSRKVSLVNSKHTTMTCGDCKALTGPTGIHKLAVRYWECSSCGAKHDRDINAARNILNIGLGSNLCIQELSSGTK